MPAAKDPASASAPVVQRTSPADTPPLPADAPAFRPWTPEEDGAGGGDTGGGGEGGGG